MKEYDATDKEKSAELAYMDGRLKHATEVVQVEVFLFYRTRFTAE